MLAVICNSAFLMLRAFNVRKVRLNAENSSTQCNGMLRQAPLQFGRIEKAKRVVILVEQAKEDSKHTDQAQRISVECRGKL